METRYRLSKLSVFQSFQESNGLLQVMEIRAKQAFHVYLI